MEPVCQQEEGSCVQGNIADQNSAVAKLHSFDVDTLEKREQCLELCRSAVSGATGCEAIWNQNNRGCYAHTKKIFRGNGVAGHLCWVFTKCTQGNIKILTPSKQY